MVTIFYKATEMTGLGEYARVLLKGLREINYKFEAKPIRNIKDKAKSYFVANAHYTQPFTFIIRADLVTGQDLRFLEDSPIYTDGFRRRITLCYKSAKHLVVSSSAIAEEFIKFYPPLKERIFIAHQGIDTELFAPKDEDIKLYDSLSHDKIRVLMVGHIVRFKDLHTPLLHLMNNPKFEITIVKNPSGIRSDIQYERELNGIINESNNIIQVSDLSYPQLKRLYVKSDILLHPSLNGGFEMPVYEALAMGTDVIARPLPLHKELLGDKIYYSDFGNDLVDEIIQIVDFKKKLNLHTWVEENYSHKTMAVNMVKVYKEVFGE